MNRFLALAGLLAISLSTGCGKAPESTGTPAPAPPAPAAGANTKGPSDAGPIDAATAGGIKGVVKLDGWLRPDMRVPMDGIPACSAQHKDPPIGETLIMGEGQTMANVLVVVTSGLGNRKFDVPKEAVVFDQEGCVYKPHVRALRANQPLIVRNGDNLLHNVNGKPGLNQVFNRLQNNKGAEDTFSFPIPEVGIFVKCDVHPWMGAWLHVVGHPFFQLTGKDGAYSISGLPPGDYDLQAWHERFPQAPLVAQVTVKAKETVTQDFAFKGGKKPEK